MKVLTFPVLKLLADGKFHSGEAMAKHFNVSRASIWNALKDAEALGVEVFSVRGRGYKLPQALVLLDESAIINMMGEASSVIKLEVHDYLESTNTYLIKKLNDGQKHASCVATNLQTKGRGRRGRTWHTELGGSLAFSLLWRFEFGAAAVSGLSLAVGVAIMRALHSMGFSQAQLKWPNDVMINREKLAGILIELQGDMEGPSTAVIGIGLNLNLQHRIKRRIDQPVTDLAKVSSKKININEVLGTIIKHLYQVLREFEHHGFKNIKNEWIKHHAYQLQKVRMLLPDGREVIGIVQGIADDGTLKIETSDGLKLFSSGEISLRDF